MQRRTFIATSLASTFALAAPALAQRRFKVATTFTIIADMARNVAGERAEVVSITRPGAEIHNYEPTPSDLIGARGAVATECAARCALISSSTALISPSAARARRRTAPNSS